MGEKSRHTHQVNNIVIDLYEFREVFKSWPLAEVEIKAIGAELDNFDLIVSFCLWILKETEPLRKRQSALIFLILLEMGDCEFLGSQVYHFY